MSGVEHYPTQAGATMGGSYTGKYITCSCQADEYGEGPKIPARDYPAHIIAAVSPTITAEHVSSLADALRSELDEGSDGSTFEAVIRAWLDGDYDGPRVGALPAPTVEWGVRWQTRALGTAMSPCYSEEDARQVLAELRNPKLGNGLDAELVSRTTTTTEWVSS